MDERDENSAQVDHKLITQSSETDWSKLESLCGISDSLMCSHDPESLVHEIDIKVNGIKDRLRNDCVAERLCQQRCVGLYRKQYKSKCLYNCLKRKRKEKLVYS